MSFTIKLQRNNSESIRVNKDITDIVTLTGTFKQEVSITNPIILIESDWQTEFSQVNYMTIEIFGRSYFIENPRTIRNGLIEVTGRVDVLSSFKSYILENTAIIRKQENLWNLYLNDGTFTIYQNPMVLTKDFPTGFPDLEFVLAVAGG